MTDNYITVTQLTRYIKYKMDNDSNLNHICLKGEISNFKAHSRGHLYFTIKDENTRINAVMFAGNASKLKFSPMDGTKVLVIGKVSVYEATGGYQIYVSDMIEDGMGNLYVEFEKLKKKLEQEGLFDPKHKKKIPKIPKKIGIITAPTGAAIKDILSTIKRRWPIAETILFPSLVQGKEAAEDIVRNINRTKDFDLDVLIVGRGGGSIEDMWCFNEEIVARAIYDLDVPVISAVGHEIDFTICDFVSDLRAPTPTGAAEMAVPNISDFYNYLNQIYIRINKSTNNIIKNLKERLDSLKNSYVLKNPLNIYESVEQKFDNLLERLQLNILNIINTNKTRLNNIKTSYILNNPDIIYKNKKDEYLKQMDRLHINMTNLLTNNTNKYLLLVNKLETLNPLSTIKRGYSITRKGNKVITKVKDVKKDDLLEIELSDGKINSKVI